MITVIVSLYLQHDCVARVGTVQVAAQAERLADENLQLKAEIAVLRSQLGYLHRIMLDNNNLAAPAAHDPPAHDDDHHHGNVARQLPQLDDVGRMV